MRKKRLIIQALVALLLVWALVAGVRMMTSTRRATAEKLAEQIEISSIDDWSGRGRDPDTAEARTRQRQIDKVAEIVNRLDFGERQEARDERIGERFFRRLSDPEKERFVNLTIEKSMAAFMQALDALTPEERRRFVENGLKEIEDGRTEEEMVRAREMSEELLARIAGEGMKSYFENASADTKLDLAPLMEAMDEVMKGLSGNEFGTQQR